MKSSINNNKVLAWAVTSSLKFISAVGFVQIIAGIYDSYKWRILNSKFLELQSVCILAFGRNLKTHTKELPGSSKRDTITWKMQTQSCCESNQTVVLVYN